MNGLNYPLAQLMTIKKNRYDQALKTLEIKKEILKKEAEKLKEFENVRDKVLEHKNEKLQQLRDILDEGTTTDKIQQMKYYLETVNEKLQKEETKVATQKEEVIKAEKQVEAAKKELFARKKDLEKLEIHKKEWEKEVQYWAEQKESREQDELGSAQHSLRKKKST